MGKAEGFVSVADNTDGNRIARDEKYEASFEFSENFTNPYDSDIVEFNAYFVQPDGVGTTVPGFWYEGYSRKLTAGKEQLESNGIRAWKIRYTPRTTGRFQYYAEMKDKVRGKTYRYPEEGYISFDAGPSADKGFLKVSRTDPDFLEFDDGSPFVGIGHNLCGWEWGGTDNSKGTYEYDEWLLSMHDNLANLAQFDFCEGDQIEWTYNAGELPFSKDWQGLGRYNQQNAWKMDYRFQKAEELGVYFRLTLFHWEDFDNENESFPDWGWNRNPYNKANGGTADNVTEFFKDEKSKADVKKFLRYVIARWGYSKSLMAYELWNEIDAPDIIWSDSSGYGGAAADIARWHGEMAGYIKGADINGHLVTTSFADTRNGGGVWELANIDLSTFHRYTYFNPDYGDRKYETVETLNRLISQRYADTGKPVLVGEFALSPGGDIQKDFDRDGTAFHSQLWASVMSKAIGTAMHWTWGSYIHEYDLYYHYKPLGIFTADEDFRGLATFNNFSDASSDIRYMGLKGTDKAYLWVQDKQDEFAPDKDGYVPSVIKGSTVEVAGLEASEYTVEYYDTYTGEITGRENVPCNGSGIILNLPDFKRDIAVKVKKRADVPEWLSKDIPVQKNSSSTSLVGKAIGIHAGGTGIEGLQDDFRYVYQTKKGDFEVSGRIDSLTNLGENVNAGLMIRESELNNARFAYICIKPDGRISFGQRTGGMAGYTQTEESGFYSYLKLVRRNDDITAYVSQDGVSWEQAGAVKLDGLSDEVLAGMAATSRNPITYINAEFYNVAIK